MPVLSLVSPRRTDLEPSGFCSFLRREGCFARGDMVVSSVRHSRRHETPSSPYEMCCNERTLPFAVPPDDLSGHFYRPPAISIKSDSTTLVT